MPYITCIVASCKTRRKPNANKKQVLKCFSIPKDPILKKEWLDLCKVKDFDQARDSTRKVCIKHFKEDDFVDGLKARLLHLEPRILKKNAVPSLYLNGESEEDNANETEITKRDEMLEKLMEETNKAKAEERTDQKYGSKEYLSKLVPIAPKGPVIASRGPSERRQYAKYLKQYDSPPKKPKAQELSEHYNKVLQHDNAIYKKRINELLANQEKLKLRIKELESTIRKDEEELVAKIKDIFKHIFTPNQIDVVMGKKVRAWWNDEEYTKAYTLHHLSTNAYFYVRDTLNYPLPAFSSLQQWAARFGVDLPDCDDNDKRIPLSQRIKQTLDEIRKRSDKKKNDDMDCTIEENDILSEDTDAMDEQYISDLKQEPIRDYLDIYEDSEEDTEDTTVVEPTPVNVKLKYVNDNEIYEEIDYLDDETEDGNEVLTGNELAKVSDNVSDNDTDEQGKLEQTGLCYEGTLMYTISEQEMIDNERDNCVIEEDNG